MNKNLLATIADTLGYKSIERVKNHLDDLRLKNWIGYNPKSGYLFIRGFDKIRQMDYMPARSAVVFTYKDLKAIYPFCISMLIGCLVNNQTRDRFLIERKRGGSRQIRGRSQTYFPIANKTLAKISNLSITTIVRLKYLAIQYGYIYIRKSYRPTGISSKNEKYLKSYLANLKYVFPEESNSIKIKGMELVQQLPDLYKHNLTFKRRKKMVPYKRGYIRRRSSERILND